MNENVRNLNEQLEAFSNPMSNASSTASLKGPPDLLDSNPQSPRSSRRSLYDGIMELSRVGSGEFLLRNISGKSSRGRGSLASTGDSVSDRLSLKLEQQDQNSGFSGSSKKLLITLIISSIFIFSATSIFAPNLTVMAKEFGFDDYQRDQKLGRDLNTVFLLISCPMTLLVSYLSDSLDRKMIYILNTVIAGGAGINTVFVKSYNELYVLRCISGAAVGSQLPILYSLFGDIYPPETRIRGSALASSLYPLGVALGQVFGAFLAPIITWRYSMLSVSVPPILILFYLYRLDFPIRGCTDNKNVIIDPNDANSFLGIKDILRLFTVPSNLLLFIQGIPGSMPLGMINVYLFDFLRTDKGLSLITATIVTALVGLGSLLGTYIGGLLGQMIYLCKKTLLPFYMGGCLLSAVPLLYVFYLFEYKDIPWYQWIGYVVFLIISCGLLNVMGSNIRAILLNVNLPETRSSVICIAQIMNNVGNTLGPVAFTYIVSILSSESYSHARQMSFQYVSLFWIASSLIVFLVAIFIDRDEDNKEKLLLNRVNMIGIPLLITTSEKI